MDNKTNCKTKKDNSPAFKLIANKTCSCLLGSEKILFWWGSSNVEDGIMKNDICFVKKISYI